MVKKLKHGKWEDYWERLMINNTWADSYFIRATALYLNMTIQIMETTAKEGTPYYSIEGDLDDQGSDDVLFIGYVSKVHYQSLLLDDSERSTEIDDSELSMETSEIEDREMKDAQKLETKKGSINNMENDFTRNEKEDDKCPSCGKKFQRLLRILLYLKIIQKIMTFLA